MKTPSTSLLAKIGTILLCLRHQGAADVMDTLMTDREVTAWLDEMERRRLLLVQFEKARD